MNPRERPRVTAAARAMLRLLALSGLAVVLACGGSGDAVPEGPEAPEGGPDAAAETPATDEGGGEEGAGEDEAGEGESAAGDEGAGEREAGEQEADEEDAGAEDEEQAPGAELPRRNVQIYFPSTRGDYLIGEWREIFNTAMPGDRVKQIVADLISGPTVGGAIRSVPKGTQLRQAFVLDDGVAYLDFSSELTQGVGGGSMSELLIVYSIVDSVVANVPEIRRVGILVNGRPLETLNGHVDLRRPLPPDYSLVRKTKSAQVTSDEGSRLASSATARTEAVR